MAFNEKYVSLLGAGLHDGSSEANAWTIDEAVAGYVLGDRVNVKGSSITVSAGSVMATAGTAAIFIIFRAYDTVIGDLDSISRNSDGSLPIANLPVLNITSFLTIPSRVFFMNFQITGSYSGDMLGSSSSDRFGFINCTLENLEDSTIANVIRGDDQVVLINCDISSGVGDFASLIRCDFYGLIYGCRILPKGTASVATLNISIPTIIGNYISGNGQPIVAITNQTMHPGMLIENTIYNCGRIVALPNTPATVFPYLINNHPTDSDEWINNLYAATDNVAMIEINTRLRDITTPRTGVGDGILIGEVDTDTGGPETDYTDAANDDLSLIDGAPGVDAGLGFGKYNIGAAQNERTTSSGGTINDGFNGGFNG